MTASDQRGWGPIVVAIAICLALSPVAYVLSIGPAVMLFTEGYISWDLFEAVYQPLNDLAAMNRDLQYALFRYQDLWL